MFGLETEGIYRVPGTNSHIMSMKQLFDHGKKQSRMIVRCS